jgi:hypothetical protein
MRVNLPMVSQKRSKKTSPAEPQNPALRFHPGPVVEVNVLFDYMKFHFDAGAIAALHDALQLLLKLGGAKKAPDWVLEGALRITAERLKTGASIGKGSSGNETTEYRRQLIVYWRWRACQEAKVERARKIKAKAEGARQIDPYEVASEKLKQTFAQGSRYAIEESVKKFNKLKKQLGRNSVYLPMRESSMLAGAPALNLAKKTEPKTE